MTFFIGIDTATRNTGVCILSDTSDVGEFFLVSVPKKLHGGALLSFFHGEISKIMKSRVFSFGAIEDGSFGSAGRIFQLGMVNGIVQLEWTKHATPYATAAPTQVKKFFTGNGRAKKPDMMARATALHGKDVSDDNMADAYALARLARALHLGVPKTREEAEVLLTLKEKARTRFTFPAGYILEGA